SENISDPAVVSIPGIQKARELRLGKLDYEEIPETTNHNVSATYNDDSIFWGSQLYTQFFFQQTDSTSKVGDNRELISLILGGIEVGADAPLVTQGRQIESKVGTRFQINTPIANNSATVRWGFDYTNERNDNRELFADPVAFDQEREVNITESIRTSPSFVLNSLGIFAEGNWDVNEKLILSGGARYEKIYANVTGWQASPFENFVDVLAGNPLDEFEGGSSDASDVAFNFGVLYKASSAISLFANFSQGFSIPSLSFLGNSDPGNVDQGIDEILEPEKVDNYEIGVRGTWNSVQFTVAGYYNHADKGQNLFLEPGVLTTQFVRTPQRNYGVEATLDWQPANTWSLGGTLTWMEGEGDFAGTERSWQPLSTLEAQPMKLTFYLENQTLRSWKNRLQLLYVTNRDRAFDDGVDQVRIAGYATVDFISVLDTGLGRLEVGIENLLNRQYFPVVAQLRSTDVQEQRHLAAPGRALSIRYFLDF
ncbi:MAG: TonB-dependent receptor, partial [Okeania sp. SIO1H6]|nr:TonB-dependent receptor [Okeania sp. SIO1H6]